MTKSDCCSLTLISYKHYNTFLQETSVKDFVLQHLHWNHIQKGSLHGQYEWEEELQQAKPVSLDYFQTNLKNCEPIL